MSAHPGPGDVHAARARIRDLVRYTPLVRSASLSAFAGADVRLKLETLQDTGAFKVRGAANAVLGLEGEARARGLVTYSTGNHGRAVAHVAARLGIPATVCMSAHVAPGKVEALRRLGCTLSIEGASQDEAAERARRLEREQGLAVIDPINDPAVIAGHGTAGLELLEEFPELDTVVVPVSGGALISGVAVAVKAANPSCRVIGVSMDRGAAMHASLAAGEPVLVDEVSSLADSLQGGILLDNRHTFEMVRELVDDIVLVNEQQIAYAMAHALLYERQVLEGAAATPIAALLHAPRERFGERIALMATGNAVDISVVCGLAARHAGAVRARLEEGAG